MAILRPVFQPFQYSISGELVALGILPDETKIGLRL